MSKLGLRAYVGTRILAWWRFKAVTRGRGLFASSIAVLAIAPILGGLVGCGPAEAPPIEMTELTLTPEMPTAVETAVPTAVETSSPTPTTIPASEKPLAARVNGQPILLADYEKQVAQFETALSDQGLDLSGEEGQAALAQIHRQVLEAMINQLLTEQAAAREGTAISDEEVEARIQADIQAVGDESKFEQWLADNNLTREDYRTILRSELIYGAMFERVTAAVPTSAEQVHVRYILLDGEEEAHNVLAQLQAGGDFTALAQEFSRDESTREGGGDVGWFPQGLELMPPEVEAAAFALEVGQTSGVVASQFGYYILQLHERDPDRPLSSEMRQILKEQTFARWLEEQRASATIERFVETD
ncbi:MAG: SurA N-terminal domain-containing protein [Anaerolineae bacterium]|nr:SurA N-terminal domain-containing protein [Anaerolineae bacterium]